MSFGYNASYEATCLTYAARAQASWDFVVCEANKGWPAAHITLPLVTYVFLQDFWIAWCIPGLFEAFEIATLLFFGDFILFDTLDVERETLAGALLGDWLINGTLGVLLGVLLVRVLCLPRLVPRTVACCAGAAREAEADAHRLLMRWRYLGFWALFAFNNVLIGWVLPAGCLEHVPRDCANVGLALSTAGQALLLAALHVLHRDDALVWCATPGAPHRPYASQRWALGLLWFIVLTIHLQNFQPLVPLYLGVAGGFTQPWLIAALWIALLGGACAHDHAAACACWCRLHVARTARRAARHRCFYCLCSACACCCGRPQAWPDDL